MCATRSRAAVHTALLLPRRSFPHGILLLWDFLAVNISNKVIQVKSKLSKLLLLPGKNDFSFNSHYFSMTLIGTKALNENSKKTF